MTHVLVHAEPCPCAQSQHLKCYVITDPQDIDEEEGVRAVHEAFRLGINYFDTSPFYGSTRSEQVSAQTLHK